MNHVMDVKRSKVVVRTTAEGLLSRMAHNLELKGQPSSGEVSVEGSKWRGTVKLPLSALKVAGVVKKGVVDSTTLSSGDVQTIERKLKDEVFLGLDELTVELSGEGDRGTATLKLKPGPRTASATITSRQGEPASLEVRGRLQVSMMALGMPKVSAPLNAFSVADAVEVQFEGFFLPSNG